MWTGNFGVYRIPKDIVDSAQRLSPGLRLWDMRTRGALAIEAWGKARDEEEKRAMLKELDEH